MPVATSVVSDDLGGYDVGGTTVYPLTYEEGSVTLFLDGVLQPPPTVTAGPPLSVSGINVSGGTLYCTHQPCVICAKMIINAGIVRVVYKEGYPDEFSMQLFGEAGVSVEKYEENL